MALGTLALIGTLTSLAGTIGSGIGSAVKNKQMDTNLRNSLAQSETDANRELYSNPLTRRDNMAYLLIRGWNLFNKISKASSLTLHASIISFVVSYIKISPLF